MRAMVSHHLRRLALHCDDVILSEPPDAPSDNAMCRESKDLNLTRFPNRGIKGSRIRIFNHPPHATITRRLTLPIHRLTSHSPHPRFVNIREIRHSGMDLAVVIFRFRGICTLSGCSFTHFR